MSFCSSNLEPNARVSFAPFSKFTLNATISQCIEILVHYRQKLVDDEVFLRQVYWIYHYAGNIFHALPSTVHAGNILLWVCLLICYEI